MSEEPDPADSQMSAELHQEIAEAARLFPGYEILNLIGRGGMGTVYQARQTALDRLVAIKLMPIEVSVQHDFADRFRREARAMARLNHPNIVSVHDFGQTAEGHLFIVMEYVEGSNLAEIIQQAGLDLGQALSVAGQICAALGYAHGKGVVHRDIKPANVMVDPEGNVKVADFGLARVNEPNAELSAGGPAGVVFGTPDYMAPEQMRHMDVDHRADIYSVGVITYEMLCGEVPRGVFQRPSQRIGCDPRIDQIVLKAMQQAPELRYQSTQEMAAEIAAARTPVARTPVARARPVAGGRPPVRPTAPKRPSGPVRPPRRTGPSALPRASGPVGPVRPRPVGRVPPPAPKGCAFLTMAVLVGVAACAAVATMLYCAPWKQ